MEHTHDEGVSHVDIAERLHEFDGEADCPTEETTEPTFSVLKLIDSGVVTDFDAVLLHEVIGGLRDVVS